jgi:trans-aconitate 2-methyltransferase
MATMRWDPAQYGYYADERSRPFFELTARIAAQAPTTVVDLGCGTGELTETLAARWPAATVRGFDASPEMIEQAPRDGRVHFAVADAREFDATGTDVLISNAMLQWVSEHEGLLRAWAAQLRPGGWLAFQVPANFDAPSHRLMRALADSPAWRGRLAGVLRHADAVASPAQYLELLAGLGMRVDAWQTEYQHVLRGDDPVLEWVRGTGLRPVLGALSDAQAAQFSAQYARRLREAYPPRPYGTVFPFTRTFVVAYKPHDDSER